MLLGSREVLNFSKTRTVDAVVEKACNFRSLEVSRCGLTDRSLQLILNAMLSQENTMESIDISGNLARLSPLSFQGQIGHFGFIRKLNLSRVHRTSGPEPLVAPETMLSWRLTELDLSETSVSRCLVIASSCADRYIRSMSRLWMRCLRIWRVPCPIRCMTFGLTSVA